MRYYEIENEMYQRAMELIEKRYPVGWGGAGVIHTSKGNYFTSLKTAVLINQGKNQKERME